MNLVHRAHTTVVESDAVLCGVELGQANGEDEVKLGRAQERCPESEEWFSFFFFLFSVFLFSSFKFKSTLELRFNFKCTIHKSQHDANFIFLSIYLLFNSSKRMLLNTIYERNHSFNKLKIYLFEFLNFRVSNNMSV